VEERKLNGKQEHKNTVRDKIFGATEVKGK
jgi:hypothetical protein